MPHSSAANSISRFMKNNIFIGVVLLVLTLLLCIQPIKTSLASLNYYTAKPILERWHADPSTISNVNYIKAKSAAEAAVRLHPQFSFYSDVLSEILRWGVYAGVAENAEVAKTEAQALTQKSLEMRPVWAITWANLAQMQWNASGVDSHFVTYLENASELGGHLPEVHVVWATIGGELINKDLQLFLSLQQQVKQHVLLGLAHPRARASVLTAIKRNKVQGLVCTWLNAADNEMPRIQRNLKC